MEILWVSVAGLLDSDRERSLLQRLKSQDPDAVAELYDVYGRILYFACLRIVNNPGVAEDLVQETFLRAWHRASTLSDEYGSVGPWLVSIARHCSLDYLKSTSARTAAVTPVTDSALPPVTIDKELLSADRARVLGTAMQALSQNQRMVLELAYYEGLSQTAIAERLKQPLGTVKGWTRMALQRLRQEIDRSEVQIA